jgi:hypothetical protein
MASWLIFAAWTDNDAALWNSRWMAQQTARLAPDAPLRIEGDEATRSALELALDDADLGGIALFGHGEPHAVMGSNKVEALDLANITRVGRRWVHAMACNCGKELVAAAAPHAEIFVGYQVSLIVEWTLEDLAEELRERLAHLVTATTLALLGGVRSKPELMRRASAAADDLIEWLLTNTSDNEYLGLHVFAQQLVDRMVVSR